MAEGTTEVIRWFYPIVHFSFSLPRRGDAEKLAMVFYRKPSVFKVGDVALWRDVIHTRGSLPVFQGAYNVVRRGEQRVW